MGRGSSGISSGGRSAGLTKALRTVEDRIRNNPTESAVAFDEKGNILFDTSTGKAQEVSFTADQMKMAKGMTMTHNHPHGYYLSNEDLNAMQVMDLKELRATTPDGRAFVLEKKVGATHDMAGLRYNYGLRMFATAGFVTGLVYDPSLSRSEISHLATLEHTRIMNDWLKQNAPKYGYEFREE